MSETPRLRSAARTPRSIVRDLIRELHAYVPGEQPLGEEVPLLPKPFTKRQLADFLQRELDDVSDD